MDPFKIAPTCTDHTYLKFSGDVEVLEEENVEATMTDKDGNEIEMNGSLNNVFDGRDDTFLEIMNGMALKLSLEEQIKLMGLIIKMKQGLNSPQLSPESSPESSPKSSPENARKIMPSTIQMGLFFISFTFGEKRIKNDIFIDSKLTARNAIKCIKIKSGSVLE